MVERRMGVGKIAEEGHFVSKLFHLVNLITQLNSKLSNA